MGFAVYEDRDARDSGVDRWAGYAVPAICDHPRCDAVIDRGEAYKCGDLFADNDGEHRGGECMGCGLYFCEAHRIGDHRDVAPKPDTVEWVAWILADDSWMQWRADNPERAAAMRERVLL